MCGRSASTADVVSGGSVCSLTLLLPIIWFRDNGGGGKLSVECCGPTEAATAGIGPASVDGWHEVSVEAVVEATEKPTSPTAMAVAEAAVDTAEAVGAVDIDAVVTDARVALEALRPPRLFDGEDGLALTSI